jgi:hypothetical protein
MTNRVHRASESASSFDRVVPSFSAPDQVAHLRYNASTHQRAINPLGVSAQKSALFRALGLKTGKCLKTRD